VSGAPGARRAAVALALGALACRTGAPAALHETASTGTSARCAADGARLVGWRVVQGDGFTICAPPDWSYASNQVTDGRAYVAWGQGEPPPDESDLVAAPAGQAPGGGVALSQGPNDRYHQQERIGGSEATVYAVGIGGVYWTGATWTRPALTLTGKAFDPGREHDELEMYRSVRFAGTASTDSARTSALGPPVRIVNTVPVPVDNNPAPAYPEALVPLHLAGHVRVILTVRADGTVDSSSIVIAEASRPEFAHAVMVVLPRWRFTPATDGAAGAGRCQLAPGRGLTCAVPEGSAHVVAKRVEFSVDFQPPAAPSADTTHAASPHAPHTRGGA
jgi:TonB family protein